MRRDKGRKKTKRGEKQNGPARSLKEIHDLLRADAPPAAPHLSPEIKDTGLFETLMPKLPGHLVDYFMGRREGLPFLQEADAFYDLAADEIQRHGFPLKPQDSDLLKAPAPVLECYQLRDAYEQLQSRRALFLAPGVMKAAAAELAEQYGKLPSEPTWRKRQADLDQDTATKWFLQHENAAVEVGVLGQRLMVRKHEEDVRRGRKAVETSRKGQAAAYGTPEEKDRRWAKYQAAMDREKKSNSKLTKYGAAERVAKNFAAEGHVVTPRTIVDHTTW